MSAYKPGIRCNPGEKGTYTGNEWKDKAGRAGGHRLTLNTGQGLASVSSHGLSIFWVCSFTSVPSCLGGADLQLLCLCPALGPGNHVYLSTELTPPRILSHNSSRSGNHQVVNWPSSSQDVQLNLCCRVPQ